MWANKGHKWQLSQQLQLHFLALDIAFSEMLTG
jgi:hypothetical protein